MRKITRDSVNAFLAGRIFSAGNMHTECDLFRAEKRTGLFLHGNLIATKTGAGLDYDVEITDAGWRSNTTKERLNGVLDLLGLPHLIHQQKFDWFINGEDWYGSATIEVRDGAVASIISTRPDGIAISVPLSW